MNKFASAESKFQVFRLNKFLYSLNVYSCLKIESDRDGEGNNQLLFIISNDSDSRKIGIGYNLLGHASLEIVFVFLTVGYTFKPGSIIGDG